MDMPKYKEWSPTGFDHKGLHVRGDDEDEYQEWLVSPFSVTRDTPIGSFERSNFESAKRIMEESGFPEDEDWQVFAFGHWACGWFQIIMVRPETDAAHLMQELLESILDYPLLDDEDYSERQMEEAQETWDFYSMKDRMELCVECGLSMFAARREEFPCDDNGRIMERLTGC